MRVRDPSVLLAFFHIEGKEMGWSHMAANPGITRAELIAYLLTVAPKGVPLSMAEDKAAHIADRLFLHPPVKPEGV